MNIQYFKAFPIVILYFIAKFSFISAYLSKDIIIPPKLSDRTTSRVLVPSPLPRNMRPTTDAFESIVKRSTMNQPLVPPTIRSQNNAHRAGSDDVHLNLMVPPTISSAQKGTNAGNGQPSSQVIGILNSKPRVVCYADQPIERDIPCPGNHSTSLNVQHMEGLLKIMGGSDIKHTVRMKTPSTTPTNDLNDDNFHSSASSQEQDRLNKLLMEISLQLSQRMFSSIKRYWSADIQAITNEIITLTDTFFKYLFSFYTESYIKSIFSSQKTPTAWAYQVKDLEYKNWQSLLGDNDKGKDFGSDISDYQITVQRVQHFHQALLNISKEPKDYKDLLRNIQKDFNFTTSQIVYRNIKSAISNLRTVHSLIDLTVKNAVNTTDSAFQNTSISVDSQMREKNQFLILLSTYVKSYMIYENVRSGSSHSLSPTPFKMTTVDPEVMVITFLETKVNSLEQLLDECHADINKGQENIEKLKNFIPTYGRKRRDIIGTSDITCQGQGERIDGGNLLNLCSTCVQTTVLGENFFPRFITEKVCQPGNYSTIYGLQTSKQGCLYQPGQVSVAAGVCSEQFFHINILKRVPGKCMKVQLDGIEVITDLWELTMHPLRVGCECAVDENSKFAQFVNKN